MTHSDPKRRRRGRANRELQVVERFSDEYPDDVAFWKAHPRALNAFGRILARRAMQLRRERAEAQSSEPPAQA